MGSWFISSIE